MPDYTTDKDAPNFPESGRGNPQQLYIEHTKGLWLRKNHADDHLEIWHNGQLQASWAGADAVDVRLTTLLRYAYDMGFNKGKAANQKAMRDALGLDIGGAS